MADPPVTLPESIGPYRVVRPLARGGMAAVYEVEDTKTGDRLALKLLTQRGLARPRFAREYRALTRLDHANIVRVYRFGLSEEQTPYLTMELLDGVPAQVHAKACGRPGTPRRTSEVLRIVTAVADALGYLHERGIVHRDLKSSNVLVLRDGRVKLLDFGTARLLGSAEEITRHGEFVGTFAYASPEQLRGDPIDARSDIYSLAVLFYRLLTGRRPFEGSNPHEVARLHMSHMPKPPGDLVAGIPPRVGALVMSMLAKDPAERPQSAHAVAHVLRSLTQGHPIRTAAATALAEPQVIGRDAEVAKLRAVFERARPGRVVVVSGPPGVGRGRLLAQAARDASSLGWRVYEGTFPGPPGIGALGEAVRAAARGLPLPEGAREDPDLAAVSAVTGRARPSSASLAPVFRAAFSILHRRTEADGKPLLLILREMHRAPPIALQALRVVRQKAIDEGAPLVVIVSTDEEGDAPGSLLRLNFPEATRVTMGPLDPTEVGKLVGSILGRQAPPPVLARRIHEATAGMPGYVVEVVYSMVRQGLVEPRRTVDDRVEWLDRSGGRIAIPGSVREVLSLRIDTLPRAALRVLEALAMAGGEGTAPVLAHATDLAESVVLAYIERLERERLIEGAGDGEGRTWHSRLGLTAQLVRERIRASRRHLLQQRLADALWEAAPSAEKVRLLLAAGHVSRAMEDTVAWAEPRLEDRRAAEVLSVLDRMAERVDEIVDGDRDNRARFHLLHARALNLTGGRPDDAARALLQAASHGPRSLGPEVALEQAQVLQQRGDGAGSRAILERELASPAAEPGLRSRLALSLGRSCLLAGDHGDALSAYEDALKRARDVGDLRVEGDALVGRGISQQALGALGRAEADLSDAVHAYESIGNEQGLWHASLNLADLYRIEGRLTEALQLVEPNIDAARMGGHPYRYAGLLLNLAEIRTELYRLGEVRELLVDLETLEVARADAYISGAAALVRGRLRLASNDPAGAIKVLGPAAAAAEKAGLSILYGQISGYLGEAIATSGESQRGIDLLRRTVLHFQTFRHVPALAEACACYARAAGTRADPDLVFEPVLPWLHTQPARLVRMTYLIASADFAAALGDSRRAYVYYRDAEDALSEIKRLLTPGDAAALRVHPWHIALERKMKLF